MKSIISTLCILLLSPTAFAAVTVQDLQHQWAIANYQTSEDDLDSVFTALIEQAETAVTSNPTDPELLIWQGIIQSSYAGKAGGLGALGFSFLIGLLAAGAGILVSLRAASVREAYQKLSIGFMLMFMPLIVIVQFIPDEWTAHLVERLLTANLIHIGIGIAAFLIVVDLALLSIAMARFQRARLMLD